MPSTTFITAVESFAFVGAVGPVNIRKGETFHRDAKRLEHCPQEALEKNFEPFSPDNDVEKATAAPGERRKGGPRRAKKDSGESTETGESTEGDTDGDTADEAGK